MSKQDKHIDRIFQESFKHYEAQPSADVWNSIQQQIQPKKKQIIPFWLKTAGLAASLLLAFGLGYWFQPSTVNQAASFSNFSVEDAKIEIPTIFNSNFEQANQLLFQLMNRTQDITNPPKPNNVSNSELASNTNPISNTSLNKETTTSTPTTAFNSLNMFSVEEAGKENLFNIDAFNSLSNSNQKQIMASNGSYSTANTSTTLEEAQNEEKRQFDSLYEEDDLIVEASETSHKWFLKPVISPIFNAGNNASSALGQEVANNSSSGDVSFSYGMQVGFQLNNKWSIRTGINQVNTSYTTDNVVYAPAASAFMPNNETSAYGLFSGEYYNTSLEFGESRIFSQEGSLSQQMNFVEIPLEVEYAILAGKFGISLTGGASTFLLTENGLNLNTIDGNVAVGEAQNLNQTSFSTNLGLGINYQLSKKIKFNVEPALKYQINTFQGSNLNFNPYFFGVYSGLQFQF